MNKRLHESKKGARHSCHPGVGRLLGAWLGAGRGKRLPRPADLRLETVAPDLRDDAFLCRLDPATGAASLGTLGANVAEFLVHQTGEVDDAASLILRDFGDVVAKRQPICGLYSVGDRAEGARYERLLLPLSTDGKTIDALLGGVFLQSDV